MQTVPHDTLLKRLLDLRDRTPFPLPAATALFVKGLAGTLPRGRAVLIDYLRLQRFEPHRFEGDRHCEICGLPAIAEIRQEAALTSAHAGHASNEVIENVLPRWLETVDMDIPSPTPAEAGVLRELIDLIARADDDETPGDLEKRIAAARILPKTDKYKRYGILQTLAECGILPNTLIAPLYDGPRTQKQFWEAHGRLGGNPRSDIVLPLAGWRGHMGVDRARYAEIFTPEQSAKT